MHFYIAGAIPADSYFKDVWPTGHGIHVPKLHFFQVWPWSRELSLYNNIMCYHKLKDKTTKKTQTWLNFIPITRAAESNWGLRRTWVVAMRKSSFSFFKTWYSTYIASKKNWWGGWVPTPLTSR